jgi:hypothetical protein
MQIKPTHRDSIKEVLALIVEDLHKTFLSEERDLRKFVEKMAGIPTLNLFQNTMNRCMDL